MNFIKGRDNLACTIFVPVICGNNCSFCNTKKDYDGFVYDKKYLAFCGLCDIIDTNSYRYKFGTIKTGELTDATKRNF